MEQHENRNAYRWDVTAAAAGYDQAAQQIHPRYLEIQAAILAQLPFADDADFLLLDAGGGSGRLVERVLAHLTSARANLATNLRRSLRSPSGV